MTGGELACALGVFTVVGLTIAAAIVWRVVRSGPSPFYYAALVLVFFALTTTGWRLGRELVRRRRKP